MDPHIQSHFDALQSQDKNVQYEAYLHILVATNAKVGWSYEVWDQLKDDLTDPDPYKRSRSAQFLAHLAISDPDKRMLTDFPTLWEVTKDKKIVTARHSLQSIWKVGLAGKTQKEMVVHHFTTRFEKCTQEKNYTLIRYDIIQSLKNLYDQVQDPFIKHIALDLIETEESDKYRKKYQSIWE